jgi:hypothetical protein
MTVHLFVLLVGLAVGVVLGMAVRSRSLRSSSDRLLEKAQAAEYGIQLLVWHTGKSREQLVNEFRYRRLDAGDEAA